MCDDTSGADSLTRKQMVLRSQVSDATRQSCRCTVLNCGLGSAWEAAGSKKAWREPTGSLSSRALFDWHRHGKHLNRVFYRLRGHRTIFIFFNNPI